MIPHASAHAPLVPSLPYPSGSAKEQLRVSLSSGGHALQLLGNASEEGAEPEVLAVVAAPTSWAVRLSLPSC